MSDELGDLPMQSGTVGLLEGLATTRAIRRYRAEPVAERDLRDILFAATRGPSGSNRQPFRFMVLSEGERAAAAKSLIGTQARAMWNAKRRADGYDQGSGARSDSPKSRMARTMQRYVDELDTVPINTKIIGSERYKMACHSGVGVGNVYWIPFSFSKVVSWALPSSPIPETGMR